MIFSCVCRENILYLRHKIIEAARHTTLIVVLVIGTDFSRRAYAVERRGSDWVRNHKRPDFGVLAQLVERLLRKQKAAGSIPVCSTMYGRRKYGNTKCSLNGIEFDSKKERDRFVVLKAAQQSGIISELELQPTFELIPKITEQAVEHKKTKDVIKEKFVQHPITYTADFAYLKDGIKVVEDVKASPKPYAIDEVFKIKEKLFRWKYGFSLRRIYDANAEI